MTSNKTQQINNKLNEAIEKLEQSKEKIDDLMIEAEEDESESWDFIDELNNYRESIQSIIDKISDDNNLNDNREFPGLYGLDLK